MRGPAFAKAYRQTWLGALVAGAILAGQWLAVPWLRPWLVLLAAVLVAYLCFRTVVLVRLERRQREFEPLWLQAQSEVLREAWFEIVRFSVEDAAERRKTRDRYDLTRPGDVARLLELQAAERELGRSSQVLIEFVCSGNRGGAPQMQSAQVGLAELTVNKRTGLRFAEVRFPAASYHALPQADGLAVRPGETTFWALSDAVVTVAVR